MALKQNTVSPQYLRETQISVTIIEVKDPAHYVIKESPSLNISSEAKKFVEAEEMMQKYYQSIEPTFFQLPLRYSFVVVCKDKKFYRAQVRSILTTSKGHLIKVYLLDYGIECTVPRNNLFQIQQDFLLHPFQAIDFKLLDVTPITLVLNSENLGIEYGVVDVWDASAFNFIQELREGMIDAHIIVKGVSHDYLVGSLYMKFVDGEVKCINDELTFKKYAQYTDCWNNVAKIDDILPILPGGLSDVLQGNTTPTSSPSSSSQALLNSPGIKTVLPKLPRQNKDVLQDSVTPISSPNSLSQGSPNSQNELNDSVKLLQNLLKLRDNREPVIVQESSVKENIVRETPNTTKVETEDKSTSETKEISCNDTNASKKQLQMLLKYRNLKSSKSCLSNSSSSKDLGKCKSNLNSPRTSTDSDLSPSKNSDRPCEMLTPVKEANFSTSCDRLISPQKLKFDLSPKRKIILETTVNRVTEDSNIQNLPSESATKICENLQNAQEESLLTPSKTSVKFQDIKKLLYQKRISPSVLSQTQETETKTVEDNLNVSDSKDICQDFSKECDKDSAEILLPESGVMQDLPESLKMMNGNVFADEDDFVQCALNPKIEENNPSSDSIDSCSESFHDAKIDFSDKSLWEKQKVPALCLGNGVPKPVLSTSAIAFSPELQKILESVNFYGPSCIQSVVWPAVERGRSLAAIAPYHSGKTVGYLLPIVSNFLLETAYADLPTGNGPIAIIICSSWKKVQAVYDLFHIFLKRVKVRILTFFVDGRNIKKKIATLRNGCDILICLPCCLLEFCKQRVLCVNRCQHFILDDGSNLLTYCMNEMKQIMTYFVLEVRKIILKNLDFIICAERWTKSVASFVDKFMVSPLLLFTSFLEAAIYAKVPIYPHVCEESDKKIKLLEILENAKRTIICTTDSETASCIHSFLKCENVRSFLVNEEQEHYIFDGIIQDWKSVKSSAEPHCLIVTDSALSNMSISNANCLIHYDVPELSRLQFGNRFSCIAEHFPKLAENHDCVCHILISGSCGTQAPALMKIIRRCGVEIPKELKDLVAKEVIKNADSPLCHNYKAFGSCKLTSCALRHHIDSIADKPVVLANEGDVQALVTHICDASHFYVRILKHFPPNAVDSVCMSSSYAKIGFQLRNFYASDSNRLKVECPVVGECYILQEESKLFFRVKVLNIIPATEFHKHKIEFFFQDEGWIRVYENFQLFKCEESIQLPPPQAVEVYLCGVGTSDSSFEWNPQANRFISDLLKDREIHGKIALCLGETLWLHPVVLREKLLFINDYLNLLTLDKALIDGAFAIDNKDHLPNLIRACTDNVSLPKTNGVRRTEYQNQPISVDQPIVGYSFLEINEYEDVYVSSVISPQQVYVQRTKFVECLDDLLDKISARINEKSLKKCKSLQKGMHCIAPFTEDNRFYRAVVSDIVTDGDCAQVFFVDFGDSEKVSKDSIYVLPPELLLLPFQAIECELNGICAPHGGWTDTAVDILHDLTRDDAGDMKILQLMAYSKSCCYEGGYHYVVDLWNCEKTVSEQLLEAGLVSPAEKATRVVSQTEVWEEEEIFEDIPEGYTVSSEEDLNPEDKDHHALFCAAVAKMLLESPKKISESTPVPEASTEDEKPNNRNAKRRKEKKSNKVEEVIEIVPAITQSPLQALQKLVNFTKSKQERKSAKPFITWWDTVEQLNVLINLRGIQLYELDLSDSGFKFKTSLRGMDYYTAEHFYSLVYSKNAQTRSNAEGLNIVLNKQKTERWPRFSEKADKLFHVKYDFNHIDDSDTDEATEQERIVSPPGNDIDQNEVVSYLSEENSSHSEDESFIQPWTKLAEFRDPFSPLD